MNFLQIKSIMLTDKIKLIFLSFLVLCANSLSAQVLEDKNANGIISVVAIGDSLTTGLGDTLPAGIVVEFLDGTEIGEGYPGRLNRYLGVPVENEGQAGEALLSGGADRFPAELNSSQADSAIFFEGLNDAIFKSSASEISRAFQRIANVSHVLGRNLVLVTSPAPCCSRAGREVFIDAYNQAIKNVAVQNNLVVADVDLAWKTSCQNKEECELFNVPEGLHPNQSGYDVIAQTIAAAILGIDIFAADGAEKLSAAVGIPVQDIKVKPVQVVTPAS